MRKSKQWRWVVIGILSSMIVAGVWGFMVLRQPQHTNVAAGDYQDTLIFNGWQEPTKVGPQLGRWSNTGSVLDMRTQAKGSGSIELRMVTPIPPGEVVETQLRFSTGRVLLTVQPEIRRYHVFIAAGSDSVLGVQTSQSNLSQVGVIQLRTWRTWTVQNSAAAIGLWLVAAWLIALACRLIWRTPWLWVLPMLLLVIASLFVSPEILMAWCISIVLASAGFLLLSWLLSRTRQSRWWWSLVSLMLVTALTRFYGLNWDSGYVFHPDEWVLDQVAWTLQAPWNPQFFSYGGFLIYVYRFTAGLLAVFDQAWIEDFSRFVLIGRFYSALWSTLTVLVIAYVGRYWRDWRTGLSAGLFWAFLVLPIQNAHYGNTDSLLTLLFVAIVWACMHYTQQPSIQRASMIGLLLGLSIATKITAVFFLGAPLLIVPSIWWDPDRPRLGLNQFVKHAGTVFGTSLVACFCFSPYYFLDFTGFTTAMGMEGSDAASGLASYTYQFIGTIPVLFQLYNLLVICSPLFIGIALIGWLHLLQTSYRQGKSIDVIISGAVLIYFTLICLSFSKYVRYLLPLMPFLCLYAAAWLIHLAQQGPRLKVLSWSLASASTMLLLLYSLAFITGVYAQPDPRLTASAWMYQHIPFDSRVVTEEQEHAVLPVDLGSLYPGLYRTNKLQIYTPGLMESLDYYVNQFEQLDYVIIASRSHSVPFRNNPERFPVRACVYQAVFDGSLGLKPVAHFTRAPQLGSWRLDSPNSPWIEETFQVFDHPTVLIFGKVDSEARSQIRETLTATCAAP